MSPPITEDEPMNTEFLDERIRQLRAHSPEAVAQEDESSFLPKFLEFTAKENANKFASQEQIRSLQQVECDQEDTKITERLKIGVRPGHFCKEFERMSFVKANLADPECQPFITTVREWMDKMAETCKGINGLPENVLK